MLTKDDIRGAYRFMLGREPENDDVIDRHLAAVVDPQSLRSRVLSAPEFYRVNARDLLRYQALWAAQRSHATVEYECGQAELEKLFAHIKAVWSHLGEVEPHFSVVSTPSFKPENLDQNREAFFRSGKSEAGLLASELSGHGLTVTGYRHVVELGCGVGRVTRYLADMASSVTALDISAPHLKLAGEYLISQNVKHFELRQVTDPASTEIPSCDLFYSRIVLQHNPPPVMLFLVRRFLSALEPGGVAVFQLPTFIDGYTFRVAEYLKSMETLDNQELHALPQRALFAAIAQADCEVLSVYRDNSLSDITKVSSRLVVQKR